MGLSRYLEALIFLLSIAAISFHHLSSSPASTPRILIAKVECVSDRDTVIAFTSNQTMLRLRLLGIDASEIPHGKKLDQPHGE